MINFDLGRTYDVVTCLFSAIGIVGTYERLERAIWCMARHVRMGGALIIEPWFSPERWHPSCGAVRSDRRDKRRQGVPPQRAYQARTPLGSAAPLSARWTLQIRAPR